MAEATGVPRKPRCRPLRGVRRLAASVLRAERRPAFSLCTPASRGSVPAPQDNEVPTRGYPELAEPQATVCQCRKEGHRPPFAAASAPALCTPHLPVVRGPCCTGWGASGAPGHRQGSCVLGPRPQARTATLPWARGEHDGSLASRLMRATRGKTRCQDSWGRVLRIKPPASRRTAGSEADGRVSPQWGRVSPSGVLSCVPVSSTVPLTRACRGLSAPSPPCLSCPPPGAGWCVRLPGRRGLGLRPAAPCPPVLLPPRVTAGLCPKSPPGSRPRASLPVSGRFLSVFRPKNQVSADALSWETNNQVLL